MKYRSNGAMNQRCISKYYATTAPDKTSVLT